ncbi:MAG: LapA family protein [Deltaproteobacteria bacterium]|nr:LapA family protein [Deltaproteobacteria bacterium]
MKLLYTIVITLIMLFIITFSLVNTGPVQLKYYSFIDVSVAAYMLIFISFGIGVIFAGFMGIVERLRLSREVTKLKKKIKMLEKTTPDEKLPEIQETKTEETTSGWNS